MSLRVGIVVEDELLRYGLESVLEEDPDLKVVFNGTSASETRDDLDVAIISVRSRQSLRFRCPVVLIVPRTGAGIPLQASKLDVSALLPRKDLTAERVVLAVRAAAAGLRVDASVEEAPGPLLDDRRLEIVRLLAQGADTRAIAHELGYSERTVKSLVHDIQLTLGAHNRTQAVAEALRLGLI